MFKPKTEKMKILGEIFNGVINELETVFDKKSNIYIDFANVKHWQEKLEWHIDIKRLKQFLDSFDTINSIKFYYGSLQNGNENSILKLAIKSGYDIRTKKAKTMKWSIDVSSIMDNSPDILENFIAKPLLSRLDVDTIGFLNKKLRALNSQGIKSIEVLKCNFDVEIGRDMLIDYEHNDIKNFILWSGDSDFEEPIRQLISDGKQVMLFSTARRISVELGKLTHKGLYIFDIQKIRNFICWKKEIANDINISLTQKGSHQRDP